MLWIWEGTRTSGAASTLCVLCSGRWAVELAYSSFHQPPDQTCCKSTCRSNMQADLNTSAPSCRAVVVHWQHAFQVANYANLALCLPSGYSQPYRQVPEANEHRHPVPDPLYFPFLSTHPLHCKLVVATGVILRPSHPPSIPLRVTLSESRVATTPQQPHADRTPRLLHSLALRQHSTTSIHTTATAIHSSQFSSHPLSPLRRPVRTILLHLSDLIHFLRERDGRRHGHEGAPVDVGVDVPAVQRRRRREQVDERDGGPHWHCEFGFLLLVVVRSGILVVRRRVE